MFQHDIRQQDQEYHDLMLLSMCDLAFVMQMDLSNQAQRNGFAPQKITERLE